MLAAPSIHSELIPVSVATLTLSSVIGIDFYLCTGGNDRPMLFCASADPMELCKIQRLLTDGMTKLYIHSNDRQLYQTYLRENCKSILANEHQPVEARMNVMSEVIRDVLKQQFAVGTTQTIVDTCQTFGKSTVALLGREPVVLKDLVRVLHHDYGTFTHSANVSAFSVMLGKSLGFSFEDLEQIAVGGLLHDLGKLEISDRILNKPGKLDENEMREIRKHPVMGLQRVADRVDLSMGQMMMIYQHHERNNGSGYPVGCHGHEIHPWARMCAIVDVYEALTAQRPYRQALSIQTALAVLERGRGTEYDEEMLECWQKLVTA